MGSLPYLPLWVADFMSDTQHLDCRETGAYLLLLFAAWRSPTGGLPDDDRQLARLARCSLREWIKTKGPVMAFWHRAEDGQWHQKRLDEERELANAKSDKARGSASARWLKDNKTTHADAQRAHSVRNAPHTHTQIHKLSHGETSTDPERASAPDGARARSRGKTYGAYADPDGPEMWRLRLKDYKPGKWWSPNWGPRPEEQGCRAPRSILDEWKLNQVGADVHAH